MRCYCRKKSEIISYVACCGPYHAGMRAAPTADVLMRSRYSAFVLENADYLGKTWHASTRPARIDFTFGVEWVQLRVLETHTTGEQATVEFIARSRIDGQNHALHEVSRFVREGGRWLYVDGVMR